MAPPFLSAMQDRTGISRSRKRSQLGMYKSNDLFHSLLTYLLTPWSRVLLEKLSAFAANQETLNILLEPEASLPHSQMPATCLSVMSQINPVHVPSHFVKINLNIILPSTPGSSKSSLFLRFLHQNTVYTSILPYVLHSPPIPLFSICSPEEYLVRNTDHE